ncbi:MAG: ribonuclease-3 [Rhodothermales bacterium]|jgi:ribonuclease-3
MTPIDRIRGWLSRTAPLPLEEAVPDAAALDTAVVAQITNHPVGDPSLYEHAMRHRSVLRGRPGSAIDSNERLEFLGDAILGAVTAEYLYQNYPNEDEGFLTRLRSKLVNGEALATHGRRLGLDELVVISDNLRLQGQAQKLTSVMADSFEALIGALYLDQGSDAARKFIVDRMLLTQDLDALMEREDNHKSLLLEFAQARGWPQPLYRTEEVAGPSHNRRFTVQVLVQGNPEGSGLGKSKKQAEQLAAASALETLRNAEDLNEEETDANPNAFHEN